jgi:hypothetical protein
LTDLTWQDLLAKAQKARILECFCEKANRANHKE